MGTVSFSGGAGRTITLGDANSFNVPVWISTATVKAGTLADGGAVSSLGVGTKITLNYSGVLSYTGSGATSNRAWTASWGGGTISNDGSGALSLSGDAVFANAATLTFGGTYTGADNSFSGVISGAGNLASTGSSTWVLSGANTRTGAITVDGGTLRAGHASAFGTTTGITINAGMLDLNGYDLSTTNLAGSGGTLALGSAGFTLTLDTGINRTFNGTITGTSTGSFTKLGGGTLTLTGANTYGGATTIGGGTLALDFAGANAPADNILSASSVVSMGGSTLAVTGKGGIANTQSLGGLTITDGNNTVSATSGAAGSLTLNLGAITHSGGLVNFVLPEAGAITTTSAALGGWATVNGSDYAKVLVDEGGKIVAFTDTDYTDMDDASQWQESQYITDVDGFFSEVGASVQLAGLRYTQATAGDVTIAAGQTLGIDGTIIVAPTVESNGPSITGGSITGTRGGGQLGIQQNSTGNFIIGSQIVDNTGVIGFTKAGDGLVTLANADNSYTGATVISAGTLAVASIKDGGINSAIGASSADPGKLVIQGATLQYTGGDTTSDRGFTIARSGAIVDNTIAVTEADTNLTFEGEVVSPDGASLVKAGPGTLTLANGNSSYTGVTTVSGGTLAVSTLADGGVNSSIGASSAASSNLMLVNGGELEYTGGTIISNRGFTTGYGGGAIDVANGSTELTLSGVVAGNFLTKNGAGTLVLSGANTYTGGTIVNAGTLRAGSPQAFGNGTVTVNAGGTLDLGGYNSTIRGLDGSGTVDLGGQTLTLDGSSRSFTGNFTGINGNITLASGGQTFSGCTNSYTGITTITGSSTLTVGCLRNGDEASDIGASSNLASNLVFNNGALVYTGDTVTTDRGFRLLANTGAIGVQNSDTILTFGGQVTGGGTLRKDAAGILVLSGTNDYTGGTTIRGGTLRAGSTSAFGTGGMTVNAGTTLDLDNFSNSVGGLTGAGNVTLGSAMLTLSTGAELIFSGAISGTGGLIKNGSGTQMQTLSGVSSSYEGSTTINGGILAVSSLANGGEASSIGASTAVASNLVLNGGTLRYTGSGGSTDRLFTLGAAADSTLDASGAGAIHFTSTGTMGFAGAGNRTLTLTGSNTLDNSLAVLIADNGAEQTALTKTGEGTWVLTNAGSTYTGATTILGGVLAVDTLRSGGEASSIGASSGDATSLVIGNTATLRYTGDGDVTDRLFTLAEGISSIESSGTGAIVFENTAAVTYSGLGDRTVALGGTNTGLNTLGGTIGDGAGGTTTLAKNGTGTWVLTGNNSFTGNTVVNDGNLMIGNGGTTGNAGAGNVIVNRATSTLSINRSDQFDFTGTLSGPGMLAQIGAGTTVLTSTGNAIGAARIDAGTLQVDGALTTATLAMNGASRLAVVGTVSAASGAMTAVTGDAGASTIEVAGSGVLTASGDLGAGSDAITLAGTLNASTAALSLGDGDDMLTLNDGGALLGAGVAAGAGTDTLAVNNAVARTLSGTVVGGFERLNKQGIATLTLTGDHSYTAGATITAGILQLGDGTATGTLLGDVVNSGTLAFNRSDAYTFGGLISGSGTVTQTGSGTTVLTGANSYLGATTVEAGTLRINGNQSAATGLTTVRTGATLGGDGIIGGDVLVENGGILAPGNSPGVLTINGDLTLNNASELAFEFGEANVAGGLLNDLIRVGGDLTLDGTLDVTVSSGGGFGPGIYRVFEYGGSLVDNDLTLGSLPVGSNAYLQTSVANQVNLVNTAGLTLNYWDGDAGPHNNGVVNGGSGTWRADGDINWTTDSGQTNGAFTNAGFAIFQGTGGTVTVDTTNGPVQASGMQFAVNGYTVQDNAIELVGPEAIIRVGVGSIGADYVATIDSALTGTAQLVKADLGTLVLTGTNSYTGGTAINGGTLQVASDANLGAAPGALTFDGGTLATTTTFTSGRAVTLEDGGGRFTPQTGTTLTLTGTVGGAGNLTKDGAGTLILTADNSYAGGTTITTGTLQVGNGGATGAILGDVVNNGTLTFNRTGALTFAGAVTGTGGLNVQGGLALTMTGDSTYSGDTAVSESALILSDGGSIIGTGVTSIAGPNSALTVRGPGSMLSTGTLNVATTIDAVSTVTIENGGVVAVGDTASIGYNPASGVQAILNVTGAGSRLSVGGQLLLGIRQSQVLDATFADGAVIESDSTRIGTGFTPTMTKTVTLSGAGTRWTNAQDLRFENGTLSILDGATMSTGSALIAQIAAATELLVSGSGSSFSSLGDLSAGGTNGTAVITLADGGRLGVGGAFTLGYVASATGSGTLNIGGAEGQAAAGAGVLEAATLALGPGAARLNFNHTESDYTFATPLSGTGAVNQVAGVTRLTGDSSAFVGTTTVSGGTLLVSGTLGNAVSTVSVGTGATLGGLGTIGGAVAMADGAVLNPGDLGAAPGTLTVSGALSLSAGTQLAYNFGQAGVVGGPLNDLTVVKGDLTLDGTLNVATTAGGSFEPGLYRILSYDGALTDNGLALGTMPAGDYQVQTAVAHQVNLVNATGVVLNFWDGAGAGRFDGQVSGGDGIWQSGGNDNWTNDTGQLNAAYAPDAFAIFSGAAGTVTVDNSLGDVTAAGMQFASDGYAINGGALTLTGPEAIVRVGDGTSLGVDYTATVQAELTGDARLIKSDLGTLVLDGANSYLGGTTIAGGTLQIASDAALGAANGDLSLNGGTLHTTADLTTMRGITLDGPGAFRSDVGTTLSLDGTVVGAGSLSKTGDGTLVLAGANSYAGTTDVLAGTVLVNGDQSAATGLTSVANGARLGGVGTIGGDVMLADGATLTPGSTGVGTLTIAGDLSLAAGSTLEMEFGEAGVAGGGLNDLIEVKGDLVLDGAINVAETAGGSFGAGIYRVINYAGSLTNNGLTLGTLPAGSTVFVQTSVAGQVNLVNTGGLTLNYWDGATGPKFDGMVNGGTGVWQSGAGNDNWTSEEGELNAAFTDESFAIFAGTAGTVTVDNSLGAVRTSGMQFATDGYEIKGAALTLVGPEATLRVGDGTDAGATFTATIEAELTGSARLVKTDGGTLVLAGTNSYTGGTAINGGTLQIAIDAALGAATGDVTLNGGTLATTADMVSTRAFDVMGTGTLHTAADTTFTTEGVFSGTGSLTKDGAGTLVLTGNSAGFAGTTAVKAGTLAVNGRLGGSMDVLLGGRLAGIGRVGTTTLHSGGIIAPGNGIGTLTLAGSLVSEGGLIEIEAELGGDASAADRLVVTGDTAGTASVQVINRGGQGAPTREGIKIIDVAGASNGIFTLAGDYVFKGEQAVVAGAYAYTLHKGGTSTPEDGDWYLRSEALNPDPQEPQVPQDPQEPNPIYQPGVPVYEVYAQTLQALNGLPTLQQRVGNRQWAPGTLDADGGVWGRIEGTRQRGNARVTTSQADHDVNTWKMQLGLDRTLADKGEKGLLVGGLNAHYGNANAGVQSVFGIGSLDTDGYGVGATLTWYGPQGFYADGQAQISWFRSDLDSSVLGQLADDNTGHGEAFSLELGKRTEVSAALSLTPQLQMTYAHVDFDRFTDRFGAAVSVRHAESLKTRWGVSLDHQATWEHQGSARRSHLYGLVNVSFEWLDGTLTEVSGTRLAHADDRWWGELGLGGSLTLSERLTIYGEVSASSALDNFGDSYNLKGSAGLRIQF
ncbi:autotransporter outer membrane beta-barrel domain-containing protein [Sphingosinicellaceae bacterium A1X5R2]|nr:autotransporter-associated beta strand repeat-containing protein [Pedomonas mirosovicensis]MCH8686648.1 autotransporter outer membrane beta-barrel domain-containing protein [Pedomonas mirosovicensis]